jgi:ATP-binding cassette subfamily B protein
MLRALWRHFSNRRQKQFYLILTLMIIASFLEIVSIGAVLPFLAALTAPDQLYQHHLIQPLIRLLGLTEPDQLAFPLTIIFITFSLVAASIRILLLYAMTRFSFSSGADLSVKIYRHTLYQDYSVYLMSNSSKIINGIINKTNTVISGVVSPSATLFNSFILIISITITLILVNTEIAFIAFFSFGLIYWQVIRMTKSKLNTNSQIIAIQSTTMIKSLQEGLGGIRDVLINNSQQFYCNLYRSADLPLRHASGKSQFIISSPRYIMEAIGMTLIAGLAYSMTKQEGGIVDVIPVMGAFALGAQKLLPALQQAYAAYSAIQSSKASLQDVLDLLDQQLPNYADYSSLELMAFNQHIELKNLSFRYVESSPWIFKNTNLVINKGSSVGFIGETGSGKSTLVDVIMGLLSPTNGELIIDGELITSKNRRAWQANIAHVPQNIYLSDNTIEENIAFGIPKDKINHQQVKKAAKQAHIANAIEEWQDGYQTNVGEHGVRLSGGQRQRIGIARAFYKNANILIFDEATSALDNATEKVVMEAINEHEKDITVLIIAHRITTLEGCDQIIRVEKNNVIVSEDIHNVIKTNNSIRKD